MDAEMEDEGSESEMQCALCDLLLLCAPALQTHSDGLEKVSVYVVCPPPAEPDVPAGSRDAGVRQRQETAFLILLTSFCALEAGPGAPPASIKVLEELGERLSLLRDGEIRAVSCSSKSGDALFAQFDWGKGARFEHRPKQDGAEVLGSDKGTLFSIGPLHFSEESLGRLRALLESLGLARPSLCIDLECRQSSRDGTANVLQLLHQRAEGTASQASIGGPETSPSPFLDRLGCVVTASSSTMKLPPPSKGNAGHVAFLLVFQDGVQLSASHRASEEILKADWKAAGLSVLRSSHRVLELSGKPSAPNQSKRVFAPCIVLECDPSRAAKIEAQGDTVIILSLSTEELAVGGRHVGLAKIVSDALELLVRQHLVAETCSVHLPSIANSLCLCLDLFPAETLERQEMLDILGASTSTDAHAAILGRLCKLARSGDKGGDQVIEIRACEEDNPEKVARSLKAFLRSFVRELAEGTSLPAMRLAPFSSSLAGFDFEKGHKFEERSKTTVVKLMQNRAHNNMYSRLFRVVQIVLSLVTAGKISTKRDIFYMGASSDGNGNLFNSQGSSDACIEALAKTLRVPRYALNVVSYSRGLVYGALYYTEIGGAEVSCGSTGVAIPSSSHSIQIRADADAIFVVEKECIFRRLLDDNFVFNKLAGRAILVTGCGYPDVQTRVLLNRLCKEMPHIPVYGIADWDPHGIEIMSTYTFGSTARSQEAEILACPSLRWLGVVGEDLDRYGVPHAVRMPLTTKERGKIDKMLKRPVFEVFQFWKRQLECMLNLDCKVEIEALNAISMPGHQPLSFLSEVYIHDKLCRHDYWQAKESELQIVQMDEDGDGLSER